MPLLPDYCQTSPDGRRCHCPPGSHPSSTDERVCTEDHPCDEWGACSQLCKRVSATRHKCYCNENFYLQSDGFSCKSKADASPPLLVFSTRSELRSIDLRSGIARPLISNLKNAVALDFYHGASMNFVFWADLQDDKVI